MNSNYDKYIKYKNKYLRQKQNMHGGKNPCKSNSNKIIELIFPLGSDTDPIKEIVIDTIYVDHTDSYDKILKKINSVLNKHYLTNIVGFHYIQEDGDIAYVNKELLDSTDFYDALEYNTKFYMYYNY